MKKKVLVVDDNLAFLCSIKWRLIDEYVVKVSTTKEEALNLLKKYRPDILILDLNLNPFVTDFTDAIEILKKVKKANYTKVIISTVVNDEKVKEELLKIGADGYLIKPYKYETLKKSIESLSA